MDKKSRERVVAVKVNEVIAEESKKLNELNKVELEKHTGTDEYKKLEEKVKQYNAMKKAATTFKEALEEQIDILNADKKRPMHMNFHKPGYGNNNPDEYEIKASLREPKKLNSSGTNHNDIVTDLTKMRDHENPRIKTVAQEGWKLVLEDDAELLQAFLNL